MSPHTQLWNYRDGLGGVTDELVGFRVVAKDELKSAPEYHDDNIVVPVDERYDSYYGALLW